MERISIEIGNRIVQENHGAHMVNIPNMAVRLLNIKAGDIVKWAIINGELKIALTEETHEPTR